MSARRTEVAKDGSRPVYVLRNGAPEKVSVKTGSTDGEKTEILSGLKAGDEIVTAEIARPPTDVRPAHPV